LHCKISTQMYLVALAVPLAFVGIPATFAQGISAESIRTQTSEPTHVTTGTGESPHRPPAPAPSYPNGRLPRRERMPHYPPPPPPHEVRPRHPAPRGTMWQGGHWGWHNGAYVWVPGGWVAVRPGWHWIPGRWIRAAGGWTYVEGRWAR
jgi:hypothetical protein